MRRSIQGVKGVEAGVTVRPNVGATMLDMTLSDKDRLVELRALLRRGLNTWDTAPKWQASIEHDAIKKRYVQLRGSMGRDPAISLIGEDTGLGFEAVKTIVNSPPGGSTGIVL